MGGLGPGTNKDTGQFEQNIGPWECVCRGTGTCGNPLHNISGYWGPGNPDYEKAQKLKFTTTHDKDRRLPPGLMEWIVIITIFLLLCGLIELYKWLCKHPLVPCIFAIILIAVCVYVRIVYKRMKFRELTLKQKASQIK